MDVKPSNVLLAGDGQPMLLDFHLAREPIAAGDPSPAHLGGTPGYIAPEQAEAMRAVREGRPILAALDGRADIFSLGLILHEALGGPAPKATCAPSLSGSLPPCGHWSLQAIVDSGTRGRMLYFQHG
jgi:eukaryotic-like serine/threonine-protein kinase